MLASPLLIWIHLMLDHRGNSGSEILTAEGGEELGKVFGGDFFY